MTAHTRRFPFSLDPLMAEAKRRMRQRRLLIAVLLVALAAAAAATTLTLRGPSTPSSATTGPNHPYPLGTPVTWDHPNTVTWRMTVNSATINANAQVEAVNGNVPPPAGQQYTLVNLTVTRLHGAGGRISDATRDTRFYKSTRASAPINYLLGGLLAVTRKGGAVPDQSCTPPSHGLRNAGTVNTGQTVTGNLCFLEPSSQATKLMLVATDDKGASQKGIWFALH